MVADLVHHVGGLEAQQARHLDVDARARETMLPDAIFGDLAAEGDARLEPLRHLGNRFLGDADRPHTVMDAPRRSEEPTSEIQSLMRTSYAVFCLNKNTPINHI